MASGEPESSMHEPRERDVLHPRPRERDDLAGEEEAVVAVPAEAAEGARPKRERERRHAVISSTSREQRGNGRLDRLDVGRVERAECAPRARSSAVRGRAAGVALPRR